MRRTLCLLISLCVLLILGTGFANESNADSAPPVAGAGSLADMKPIKLTMSTSKTEKADAATVAYYNRVSKRSDGKVSFDFYFTSSLVTNIREVPNALKAGICDVSQLNMGNYTGLFPLNSSIVSIPFMGMNDNTTGVYGKLMEAYPDLNAEYAKAGIKLLSYSITRPFNIHVKLKEKYSQPSDLSGLKIAGVTVTDMEILKKAGVIPVTVAYPDIYSSLEKNVINGVVNHAGPVVYTKFYTHVNNHIVFGENSGMFVDVVAYVMRLETWNALPREVQQIFMEEAAQFQKDDFKVMKDTETALQKLAADKGGYYIVLTGEQIQPWKKIAADTVEKLIAEKEKANPKFRDMYKSALELIAKSK